MIKTDGSVQRFQNFLFLGSHGDILVSFTDSDKLSKNFCKMFLRANFQLTVKKSLILN